MEARMTQEDPDRKRAEKHVKEVRDFFYHLMVYVLVCAMLVYIDLRPRLGILGHLRLGLWHRRARHLCVLRGLPRREALRRGKEPGIRRTLNRVSQPPHRKWSVSSRPSVTRPLPRAP